MNANDPAFPNEYRHHEYTDAPHLLGLSKRELFAAMAMQGMLANETFAELEDDRLAIYSVSAADALIAELAKKPA